MLKNDPIGTALQDFMLGKADTDIIVESNITEDDILPVNYLFRNKDAMPQMELTALKACKGKVLEIGAGAGNHSLMLQEDGMEVTALDISDGAVTVMKARGVKQVVQANIYDLKDITFDTLLMLMNGIGVVGDLHGLYTFLEHAKTLLNPGGQIILESSDILYMFEDEDGSVLLDLNAGYYGEVTYNMKYKQYESGNFKWLFIDAGLLEQYAEEQDYLFEILEEGEHGNYLAKLTLK
jgi:SAM-dependent methyltransferase